MSDTSDEEKMAESADDNKSSFGGISRRDWLKASAMGLAGTSILGSGMFTGTTLAATASSDADPTPKHSEVGGAQYDSGTDDLNIDYTVTTAANDSQGRSPKEQLNTYLSTSDGTPNQRTVIWINRAAATDSNPIDITSWYTKKIPQKTTIAGNRDASTGERGPKLTSTNEDFGNGVMVAHDTVRFTGIQFAGPSTEFVDKPINPNGDTSDNLTVCIRVDGSNVEIDNCEFWGFTNAGVRVGNSSGTNAVNTHIHHCSFHDNAMKGYGYGVVVDLASSNGSAYNEPGCLIEYNYLNNNRHSIAGNGGPNCNYTARYNIQGPNSWLYTFDMHGDGDNGTGGTAGGKFKIYNNTFKYIYRSKDGKRSSSVGIRGYPDTYCQIYNNWFHNSQHVDPTSGDTGERGDAINQETTSWGNTDIYDNHYGQSEPASGVGAPSDGSNLRYNADGAATVESNDSTNSSVSFSVTNEYDSKLNITNVSIDPARESVDSLYDHSMDEGKWKSELYVDASLQDCATDLSNGLDLPGSIDLKNDGHSGSDYRWAVVPSAPSSGDSTADVYLQRFESGGSEYEMLDEGVSIAIDYYLDDGSGTTGTERFVLDL